jgi:hypothetical protein
MKPFCEIALPVTGDSHTDDSHAGYLGVVDR